LVKNQFKHGKGIFIEIVVFFRNFFNLSLSFYELQIDRYISGRYLGFADMTVSAKTADFIGLSSVDKTLLYSSHTQTTCARKHKKAGQDSYLAVTLAGAFS